jgi:hypothetical protein
VLLNSQQFIVFIKLNFHVFRETPRVIFLAFKLSTIFFPWTKSEATRHVCCEFLSVFREFNDQFFSSVFYRLHETDVMTAYASTTLKFFCSHASFSHSSLLISRFIRFNPRVVLILKILSFFLDYSTSKTSLDGNALEMLGKDSFLFCFVFTQGSQKEF